MDDIYWPGFLIGLINVLSLVILLATEKKWVLAWELFVVPERGCRFGVLMVDG